MNGMPRPASLSHRPARILQLVAPMPSPSLRYTEARSTPPLTTAATCLTWRREGSSSANSGTVVMPYWRLAPMPTPPCRPPLPEGAAGPKLSFQ
eukprot:6768333-Lingulodinium_polyedra.AAC.2